MVCYALAAFMGCLPSEPLPVCLHWRMVKVHEQVAAGAGAAERQRGQCWLCPQRLSVSGWEFLLHSATSEGKQAGWKVCPFCMQQVDCSFHGTWTHPQNWQPGRSAVETCRDNREKSILYLMVPHRGNKPCLTNSRNVNQCYSLTGQVASWEANHVSLFPFRVAQGGSIAGREWHLKLFCWGWGLFLCCEDWCTKDLECKSV